MAEFSGTLCSGDLLPTKATYALAANKIKHQGLFDRETALMRLTRKYFQSHQPATLEDFVWWSGLNVNDCRKGIALLGDTIHKTTWKGRDFYLTDNCRTRGFRTGKLLLIPPYDEYLIGYKSRDIVLAPEHRHRAHNNSGIFQPIIARDGIICGNWSPFREDCQADFFDGSKNTEELQEMWQIYMKYKYPNIYVTASQEVNVNASTLPTQVKEQNAQGMESKTAKIDKWLGEIGF